MKTLVVTPLKKELKSLVSVLKDVEKNELGFSNSKYDFVSLGLGSLNFKKNLIYQLKNLKPRFVVCAGSCGALRDFDELEVVEVKSVSKREGSLVRSDATLKLERTYFDSLKKAHCASGDESVLSEVIKNKILQQSDSQIVTWETIAFFETMKNTNIPFTELRVVTDLCDERGLEDFNKNLSQGMQKIGRILNSFEPV